MAVFLLASAATLELTPDNFDKEVFESGKSAFIKFLAPWCGHCKSMKPAWDSLAQEFASSDKVIVADVDCTAAGEPLCSKYGVEGFPTIKFFNPPDDEGEDYDGGRDLDALKEFTKTLGPGCSASTLENCTPEQKAELDAVMEMSEEDRATELAALQETISKMETDHEELLKRLQAEYDESNTALEEYKKKSKPRVKLLKKASAGKAAASTPPKDEV